MIEEKKAFDYLVIGAGSAGCVVASELAKFNSVGLVEAGEEAPQTCHLRRPADFLRCFGTKDDWDLVSVAQNALAGRRIRFPRGRGLGGSTRINASIWLPPEASCCARFEEASGGVWSSVQIAEACQWVESKVSPERPRWLAESSHAFLEAADNLGLAAAPFQRMNFRGVRRTAADVWIGNERERQEQESRLTVLKGVMAERLVIDRGTAIGAELAMAGEKQLVTARCGVIVCCGTIQTPRLLWSSGIGCPKELTRVGIEPTIDSAEVGQGLRDHLVVPVIFDTTGAVSLPTTWSPREIARWQHGGTGPIASNIAEAGLLLNGVMRDGLVAQELEDSASCVQLFCTPTDYLRYPGRGSLPRGDGGAMTIGIVVSRPQSIGCLRLNAQREIEIDPSYWNAREDRSLAFDALRVVRRLASTMPLARLITNERSPGSKGMDEEGFARIASRTAKSLYHPVGTCRMGTDSGAVVEPTFRLRGAENVWIVDASVFPFMPIANPNVFVMGLARLAAGAILEEGVGS